VSSEVANAASDDTSGIKLIGLKSAMADVKSALVILGRVVHLTRPAGTEVNPSTGLVPEAGDLALHPLLSQASAETLQSLRQYEVCLSQFIQWHQAGLDASREARAKAQRDALAAMEEERPRLRLEIDDPMMDLSLDLAGLPDFDPDAQDNPYADCPLDESTSRQVRYLEID
jgi:hypothetical protein